MASSSGNVLSPAGRVTEYRLARPRRPVLRHQSPVILGLSLLRASKLYGVPSVDILLGMVVSPWLSTAYASGPCASRLAASANCKCSVAARYRNQRPFFCNRLIGVKPVSER